MLTAESRIFAGTLHISRTTAACLSNLVHLTIDKVAGGCIVTSVELCKPFTVLILCQSTTDLICVRPQHSRIVPPWKAKSLNKINKSKFYVYIYRFSSNIIYNFNKILISNIIFCSYLKGLTHFLSKRSTSLYQSSIPRVQFVAALLMLCL